MLWLVGIVLLGLSTTKTEELIKQKGDMLSRQHIPHLLQGKEKIMDWFSSVFGKTEGTVFQKITQATEKIEQAKGKFIAIEAAHSNILDEFKAIEAMTGEWHSKFDAAHSKLDAMLAKL